MVLPSVDNKSIKKTLNDPLLTETKVNTVDFENFSEKAHIALLVCLYSQHWIFSDSMSKSVKH